MRSRVIRIALFVALAAFYVTAATEHAKRVNTSKARGDQSGYLWDAQNVYGNWHGAAAPLLIGERNRMPVYAAFLAAFWDPALSNDEFFDRAKRWNIYLSVGLLALLAVVFAGYLPPLPATNLTLVVAFGYFIFKAGYTQSELLYYFLFFITFLLFWEMIARPGRLAVTLCRAAAAGAMAALAYLTKAALLPLLAVFLVVCGFDALRRLRSDPSGARRQLIAALVVTAVFLAVLSPYLRTNKRVFGQYFYNVNTTFYIWYDNWPQASIGTIKHGDGVGWPAMPLDDLPSASKYWREHTMTQVTARVGAGLWDMLDRSYHTYWYLKYLVLYLGAAAAVTVARRRDVSAAPRRSTAAVAFLVLYGAIYLLGIAFYAPVSGTGTSRFLIAHLTPLFFVLSLFLAREPGRHTRWTVGGATIGMPHFHLLVGVSLAVDIVFVIWPRLMTTYGGF
ncbi:MAG: hypothetical protein ABI868_25905 [Acidobacteriota bacterium]